MSAIEPGWYPDRENAGQQRYWDGSSWTEQRRQGEGTEVDPTARPAPSPGPNTPWYRRPLGGWKLGLALAAALLVGVGIGAAGSSSDLEQAKSDAEELENELAAANEDLQDNEDALDEAQEDARKAERRAQRKADRRISAAEDKVAQTKDELKSQERDLKDRESAVAGAENTIESNTIPDGIWQIGKDFPPGLYRADGGGGCYWALLDSADTSDIINNGGFSKNQTLEIDSAWFETNGCGDWVPAG